MFNVELYRDSRLLEAKQEPTERAATITIDIMINAVHQGAHGSGDFRVFADEVNELGLFKALLFDSESLAYPVQSRAA